MNIKVGDKVRIKTEEELLAEGFVRNGIDLYCSQTGRYFVNPMCHYCGQVVTITKTQNYITPSDFNIEEDNGVWNFDKTMVAEVIPQTLDEYICGLPLEERAEKFILHFEGYGTLNYYSSITKSGYLHYDEALQATIEALKGAKE